MQQSDFKFLDSFSVINIIYQNVNVNVKLKVNYVYEM